MSLNYKVGANPTDLRNMKALFEQGYSAQEISDMLMIVPSCTSSFVDAWTKEKEAAKPKAKPRAKPAS